MTNCSLEIEGRPEPLTGESTIREFLQPYGIEYRQWFPEPQALRANEAIDAETALRIFHQEIADEKRRGGFRLADGISITDEDHSFNFGRLHWHDEDEVRMIVRGAGVFTIQKPELPPAKITVYAGDFLRIPAETLHSFSLEASGFIIAVRLFKNGEGWVPHYDPSKP